MPKMMPGSKPSKRPQFDNYYDKTNPGASAGRREAAYQRFTRPPKVEDQIRDLIVERAGRRWGGAPGAPAGWMKEINGPGWMGPNGEYWDGQGDPPWAGGGRPSRSVDGDTLFYPHGGGPPTTTPPYGVGFSFSPRG